MNRSELIAELGASNPHLQKADVGLTVAAIFDQITAALVRGARVELRGFGVFTVKQRNVLSWVFRVRAKSLNSLAVADVFDESVVPRHTDVLP